MEVSHGFSEVTPTKGPCEIVNGLHETQGAELVIRIFRLKMIRLTLETL